MKSAWISRQSRHVGYVGFLSAVVGVTTITPVSAEGFAERLHRWEKKLCQPAPNDTRCRARTPRKPAKAQTTKEGEPATMAGQASQSNSSLTQQGPSSPQSRSMNPTGPGIIEQKPLAILPSTPQTPSKMNETGTRAPALPPGVILPASRPVSKPPPVKHAKKKQPPPETVVKSERVNKPPRGKKKLTDRVAPSTPQEMGPEFTFDVPDQVESLKPSSKFAVAVPKLDPEKPEFAPDMSGSSSFSRQPPLPVPHVPSPVQPQPEVVAQVGRGGMASMVGMMAQTSNAPPSPDAYAACQSQLKELGVTFQTTAPSGQTADCVVENPVQLMEFAKGNVRVSFPDKPTLNCKFAVRFTEWLSETGAPIALAQTHSPIAQLYTGPGFECRGRNGDTTAKISEHAKGNAVDIERVVLSDGRVLVVKDAQTETSPSFATLKGLRGSACGYFTTVLGPGANAAHESHFHFDQAIRGKAGNYKICE